jgi:hypothetical protein
MVKTHVTNPWVCLVKFLEQFSEFNLDRDVPNSI